VQINVGKYFKLLGLFCLNFTILAKLQV